MSAYKCKLKSSPSLWFHSMIIEVDFQAPYHSMFKHYFVDYMYIEIPLNLRFPTFWSILQVWEFWRGWWKCKRAKLECIHWRYSRETHLLSLKISTIRTESITQCTLLPGGVVTGRAWVHLVEVQQRVALYSIWRYLSSCQERQLYTRLAVFKGYSRYSLR